MVAADGHTYERWAIEEWLRTNNTSPKTREVMTAAALKPNHVVKALTSDWNERQARRPQLPDHIPFAELQLGLGDLG